MSSSQRRYCSAASIGANWCDIRGLPGPLGHEEMPMPAVAVTTAATSLLKDLYAIGEIPPLGHVPAKMHAWAIRQDRQGPPDKSMQVEVVPTWPIGDRRPLAIL